MKTIALNRLSVVGMAKGTGWNKQTQVLFLAELANLGYRITNPEALAGFDETALLDFDQMLNTLKTMRGGQVDYVPLFSDFPNQNIKDNEHFFKRIIGWVGNRFGLIEEGVTLENGTIVPTWLFDLTKFGADPITQNQTQALYDAARKAQAQKEKDTHTEWIDLTLMDYTEMQNALKSYMQKLLYAKSSIKEAFLPDLKKLLYFFGAEAIDAKQLVFKETRAFVLAYFWQLENYDAVAELKPTATDLLRLFAVLTETDVALIDDIRFPKFSRKQRRTVLAILEQSAGLAEDLRNYKGLWLELGRYLHPFEYAKRYPRTAKLFDALRNGKIETFNSKTDALMADFKLDLLLAHLETRPGLFLRKLHHLLRTFPANTTTVLDRFEALGEKMVLKNLLVLQAYFNTINDAAYRTVINRKGKVKVLLNGTFQMLTEIQVIAVRALLNRMVEKQLSTRDSWEGKKVWIDPNLERFTVPLSQRKGSDSLLTVGRGSRVKADFNKVLRLFTYWKESNQRTDLDLSVIQYDEDFNYMGHVSYTNLSEDGVIHSGDITSAPLGAAEFIDISLDKIPDHVQYLAVQIYRYTGDAFTDMEAMAGWMFRDKIDSNYASFDVKTVANKMDLNGTGAYVMPLMVDLKNKEILITDLYIKGQESYNRVESTVDSVRILLSEVSKMVHTRPVMEDLALAHTLARGAELIEDKTTADITFGIKDSTYNATDIEQVLSDLI